MPRVFLVPIVCIVSASAGCDFGKVTDIPTEPSVYSPPPVPPRPVPPPIAPITFGEVVRFHFKSEDFACSGEGRCLSFYVTPPSDGTMDVVIKPLTPNDPFFPGLELYIVPGADEWVAGTGPQISAAASVKADYDLRTSLR